MTNSLIEVGFKSMCIFFFCFSGKGGGALFELSVVILQVHGRGIFLNLTARRALSCHRWPAEVR